MTEQEAIDVFAPHLKPGMAAVSGGRRLVHYTTAEAAFQILSNREVWLRNSQLMNDYSEGAHGLTCLQQSWQSESGLKLQNWMNETWPGLRDEVMARFDSSSDHLRNLTYIASLSEHDDGEDKYGRLSMWRAYGGRSGVALVLNTEAFLSATNEMRVFSAPVVYRDVDEFVAWFATWVEVLIDAQALLEGLSRPVIVEAVYNTFRTFVLATKHPGFSEEKEWRVFHSPLTDGASDWIRFEPTLVGGVPQHVAKFQLRDDPERGVVGVSPPALINRVIIGPCESAMPVRDALGAVMEASGIVDVADRIWMSFIPLRHR